MTKRELLRMLCKFPDDAEVVVKRMYNDGCYTFIPPHPIEAEVIEEINQTYDRYYDIVQDNTDLVYYHGQEGITYSNKRKVIVL